MPWWKADSAPKHGLFDQKTKKKKTFLTSTEEILSSQHVKPNILNGENLPILCCCDSAGALVMVGEWSILTSSNNRTPVLCWKIHSTIPALGDDGAAKWSCLRWSQTSPSKYQIILLDFPHPNTRLHRVNNQQMEKRNIPGSSKNTLGNGAINTRLIP